MEDEATKWKNAYMHLNEMYATQAAQIEALRDRLKEARDYVGKGFMPSGLLDRIDAALAGDKHD